VLPALFSFRARAAQSGLSHPSIVRVVGAYHEHERLSIVMEWVRGGDLFDAICRSGA
jgi:serine/threonine protein kinase